MLHLNLENLKAPKNTQDIENFVLCINDVEACTDYRIDDDGNDVEIHYNKETQRYFFLTTQGNNIFLGYKEPTTAFYRFVYRLVSQRKKMNLERAIKAYLKNENKLGNHDFLSHRKAGEFSERNSLVFKKTYNRNVCPRRRTKARKIRN